MDDAEVTRILKEQQGVIARRQVRLAGGTDNDIEGLLRRRQWVRVHRGVYVDHTGTLTREQRAWAGVLAHWPSALAGASALSAWEVRTGAARDDDPIDVVVDEKRHTYSAPGVRERRLAHYEQFVQASRSPPRMRLEHALLETAADAPDDAGALGIVADAVQDGRTVPRRLVAALGLRPRLPRRQLLLLVLKDVASGAYSVLEQRYLHRVERAHGLPSGERQFVVRQGRAAYRDVQYREFDVAVELDGSLNHDRAADRWADLERDVTAAVMGTLTIRLGWQQVLDQCRTACSVGQILVARGWEGTTLRCGEDCTVFPEGSRPIVPEVLR